MKPIRIASSLVLALVVAGAGIGATRPQATEAASSAFCQCIIYVQNYVGYIGGNAKDAGPVLKRWGYRESSSPMGINDIVVMQPGFAGANAYAGHIGFLAGYRYASGRWTITLRGTNQPGGWWTDHGCYNVSQWTFSYTSNWGIRFYRR